MSFDAVLPPPLSRAIKEARADAVRAVRQRVDDFLSELDDDMPSPAAGAAARAAVRIAETPVD